MPEAITHGIRIQVESQFIAEQSKPEQNFFTFTYDVVISNVGQETRKLLTRHWIITDGNGKVDEVKGPGVVGNQPVLEPGQSFAYTSGSRLSTPYGTMHGTYQMVDGNGDSVDVTIPVFRLSAIENLN